MSSDTIEDFPDNLLYGGISLATDDPMNAALDLKARIYKARKDAEMTQADLASAVGKTRGAVAQWESGEVRPRHATLKAIARATGKSLPWLENGIDGETTGLTVIGSVEAGMWKEGHITFKQYGLPVTPHPGYPGHAQRLYVVSGSSVNRVVQEGEYVHCVSVADGDLTPVHGDLVIVRRMEHGLVEYTVKRLIRNGGGWILRPESDDDEHQEDIVLTGDDSTEIQITDIVIAAWKPIARGSI